MSAKWNNGYTPEHLTKRIDKCKIKDKDGKVSFSGFEITEYLVVLNSMVSLNNSISEIDKNNIVREAVFITAKNGEVQPDILMKEIAKLEKKFLQKKPQKYDLISTLSASCKCKLKSIKINDCTITFHSSLPLKYQTEIERIKEPASNTVFGDYPEDYIFVKTSTTGKTFSQASDKAIDSIDIIRGIWNLFYNRGMYRISSGTGERKPVNNIVFGPIHTIHLPSGKLATESWLYEPGYRGPLKVFDLSERLESMYKFQQNARRLLKKSNFKSFLETAFMKYAHSLDLRDWENCYVRLWGLLEYLTNTKENETHKVTVRRTSNFFENHEYVQQILNHLRDNRNRAVHAGEGNQSIETMIYQLKNFVEVVLEFLVSNKFKLASLNEVSQFMDMPSDNSILTKKIELMRYTLKHRRH